MTQIEHYLSLGLKLMPSGRPNNYQYMKALGRLGSRKDFTWTKDPLRPGKGFHSCCGSKRDYYHKLGCKVADAYDDDLSDLKDI